MLEALLNQVCSKFLIINYDILGFYRYEVCELGFLVVTF